MVVHIASFKLKDEALKRSRVENLEEARRRIESLRETVPGIRKLVVSTKIVKSTSEFDIVLYSEFDTEADLDAYRTHPAHLDVVDFIGSIRETRFALDYEV